MPFLAQCEYELVLLLCPAIVNFKTDCQGRPSLQLPANGTHHFSLGSDAQMHMAAMWTEAPAPAAAGSFMQHVHKCRGVHKQVGGLLREGRGNKNENKIQKKL